MSAREKRVDEVAVGLTLATGFALAALIVGLIAWLTGVWTEAVAIAGTFYVGYEPTLAGSVIGAIWGLVDGFIDGYILAWLYNRFAAYRA